MVTIDISHVRFGYFKNFDYCIYKKPLSGETLNIKSLISLLIKK